MDLVEFSQETKTSSIPLRWVLVCAFSFLTLIYFTWECRFSKTGKLMKTIPGPLNLPLIGSAYIIPFAVSYLDDFYSFVKSLRKSGYTEAIGGIIGRKPQVLLLSHKTASVLLRSEEFAKAEALEPLKNLLGDGVFLTNGDLWKHRRRLAIMYSSSNNRMKSFLDVFIKQSQILVEIMSKELVEGVEHDLEPYIERCVLDSSFECIVGKSDGGQQKNQSALQFLQAFNRLLESTDERMTRPWLQPDFIWSITGKAKSEKADLYILRETITKFIDEKRQDRAMRAETKMPFEEAKSLVDIFLDEAEHDKSFSEEDIYQETLTMITGARDTSTISLTMALFCLVSNTELWSRAQNEVDEVLRNHDDCFTSAALADMTFLECCVKESLRLFPPGPFLYRYVKSDLDLENGMVVPANSVCTIIIPSVHRDPELYEDPDSYNPERWFEPDPKHNAYSFLSFSAGKRNCVGTKFGLLQIKVMLAHLLKEFNISTTRKIKNAKVRVRIFAKFETPVPYVVIRRTGSM